MCAVLTSFQRTQLRPWLEAFPREQLLVLFMDDMRTPEAAHAQVAKVRYACVLVVHSGSMSVSRSITQAVSS